MEIARGAEAVLTLNGDRVSKDRIKKNYRIDEIDVNLRKERTKTEVRLMEAARRAGVPVPLASVFSETIVEMDFIEGTKLRDVLDSASSEERENYASIIGRYIALLHRNGIVHGDLTTSNMIIGDRLYLIDFGLGSFSTSTEDRAVDLYLLYNALKSTHFKILEEFWFALVTSYEKEFDGAKDVLTRFRKIELRGRYVVRIG